MGSARGMGLSVGEGPIQGQRLSEGRGSVEVAEEFLSTAVSVLPQAPEDGGWVGGA